MDLQAAEKPVGPAEGPRVGDNQPIGGVDGAAVWSSILIAGGVPRRSRRYWSRPGGSCTAARAVLQQRRPSEPSGPRVNPSRAADEDDGRSVPA